MAELRAAEQAQRGPNAPTAERAAAAGRADELRSKLLAAAPNDDNAPTWLIDRAAYALAGLAADGADASALFGVCTRGQRERIAEVAAQALAMLDRAAAAAANSTQRLESSLLDRSLAPEAAKARATEVEPLLARLVDVEQGVRIPFHRATAQVLLASASDNPARRASLTTSAVTALGGFSFPAAGAESTRLTLVAAADMLATTGPAVSPSPPPAQPPGDRRKPTDRPATPPAPSVVADSLERAYALATSRSSASETDGTAQGNLAAALWARMGLLALGLRDPAAGAPHSTHDTWRTRLLLAEAVASAGTRSGRNAATAGAGSRIATSPAAEAARLGPLLAIAREVGAAEDQADRLFIYAKIAAATSPATPFSSLDPELAFARAVTIARDSLTGAPSPPASAPAPSGATKPAAAPISAVSIEALALFRQVAEREPPPDAPEDLRPRALWESAVLLSQSTDPTDQSAAIRTLHRLFTSHGKSPFAPKAAARVAALAPQACGKASQSLAGVDVWTVCRDALEYLLQHAGSAPAAAGSHETLSLIDLYLCAPAAMETSVAPLVRAMDLIETVPTENARYRTAAERIAVSLDGTIALARRAILTGEGGADGQDAQRRLAEYLALRVRWLEATNADRPSRDAAQLDWAESLIGADDRRAVDLLTALRGTPADAPLSATRARAGLALARARINNDDAAGAFKLLRSLIDEFDGHPTAPGYTLGFWGAWAALLEQLAAADPDASVPPANTPSRADQIRQHIRRLELLDPNLGGEPYRSRIGAIRDSLK